MIKFENVVKKYGDVTALEEISFEIKDGEFVFITGSSGAGKSTIIKLILHQILPSSGLITVDDYNFSKIKTKQIVQLRRTIGVVFQDFRLLNDRTVRENTRLVLEVVGKDRQTFEERTEEVLKLVGILDRADFFPSQLAGGELQRTCIARAIVGNPKILIADEPTGNLDPVTSGQIIKLLEKINKLGTTVIMATHNAHIVDNAKQRVITLEKGKIKKDASEGKYEIK